MDKDKNLITGFLFSDSSYLTGAGSIFNLAGNYFQYNEFASGWEADGRALQSDWEMVGQDLRTVLEKYREKTLNETVR